MKLLHTYQTKKGLFSALLFEDYPKGYHFHVQGKLTYDGEFTKPMHEIIGFERVHKQ